MDVQEEKGPLLSHNLEVQVVGGLQTQLDLVVQTMSSEHSLFLPINFAFLYANFVF